MSFKYFWLEVDSWQTLQTDILFLFQISWIQNPRLVDFYHTAVILRMLTYTKLKGSMYGLSKAYQKSYTDIFTDTL